MLKKKQKLTLIYIIVSENGHKNHKVVMTDDINEIFQCLHKTRKWKSNLTYLPQIELRKWRLILVDPIVQECNKKITRLLFS